MGRSFWLVQRMVYSPLADFKAKWPTAEVISNPFGYGRLGEYEFSYMGAAEYEFGAITKANNRLSGAVGDLCLETVEIKVGKRVLPPLRMLWIGKEGHPAEEFQAWIAGGARTKESMHAFDSIARGKEVPEHFLGDYQAVVWWALDANVQWALAEEDGDGQFTSHLDGMLRSIVPDENVQFLR